MQRTHLRKPNPPKIGLGKAGLAQPGVRKLAVDWPLVHVRLEADALALEQVLTPSPSRIEEAYRSRAVRLAQANPQQRGPARPGLPVLVFRVGPERYAMEIQHLAEVLPLGYFAPIPRSPAQFLGVVSVRGELRAVVDLQHLLGLSEGAANRSGFILLLRAHAGGEQLGLKVDRIEELCEIRTEDLANPDSGRFAIGLSGGGLSLLRLDRVLESVFNGESWSK